MEDKKTRVAPGSIVGTEEEFVSGAGTYAQDGSIFAAIAGELVNDNRMLSVKQEAMLVPLRVGINVVGVIDNITEPVALVVVEGQDSTDSRFSKSNAYVVLHASRIKRGYVKNVRDEYRIGDIIRAKISEEKNGEYHISTEDEDCGCLKAFCSSCRHGLDKKPTGLECPACGRRENRKLAKDYRQTAV